MRDKALADVAAIEDPVARERAARDVQTAWTEAIANPRTRPKAARQQAAAVVPAVIATLVVSLSPDPAQTVTPEGSEHKRDPLIACLRHRELRAQAQLRRHARQGSKNGSHQ